MTKKQGRKLVTDKPVARPPRLTPAQQAREERWSAEYMARAGKKLQNLASRAAQDAEAVTGEVKEGRKRRSAKLRPNSVSDHLGKE